MMTALNTTPLSMSWLMARRTNAGSRMAKANGRMIIGWNEEAAKKLGLFKVQ